MDKAAAATTRPCWRCRKCGAATSFDRAVCGNPLCRAELSLYGEPFTPSAWEEPAGKWPQTERGPERETPRSTSHLWEEQTRRPKREGKPSRADKKRAKALAKEERRALKKHGRRIVRRKTRSGGMTGAAAPVVRPDRSRFSVHWLFGLAHSQHRHQQWALLPLFPVARGRTRGRAAPSDGDFYPRGAAK